MEWIKASERQPPSTIVDTYHVKVKYLEMDDSVLMPSACTFSGEWETEGNMEVVEWLDESPSPSKPVEEGKNDWVPNWNSAEYLERLKTLNSAIKKHEAGKEAIKQAAHNYVFEKYGGYYGDETEKRVAPTLYETATQDFIAGATWGQSKQDKSPS